MNSLEYLLSIEPKGIKLGLERTFQLMESCGSPHKSLPCIQVVGTNGKGSTSAMISSIFQSAGYKVGLFTSPHLVNVNERIRINNIPILNDLIDKFIRIAKVDIEKIDASFFEVLTTLGMWHFQQEKVDIAILETGLGGRFDSVSVSNPSMVVFTPISLDHTEILGDSLEKITLEKAGAIRKNVPCISSKQEQIAEKILLQTAKNRNSNIQFLDVSISIVNESALQGKHQLQNAQLASTVCKKLKQYSISDTDILNGLKNVVWNGRFQTIQTKPKVIFDVGHNKEGILSFLSELSTIQSNKKTLILSLQSRKNIKDIVPKLEKEFDCIICSQTNNKHGMDASTLRNQFSQKSSIKIEPNLKTAITTSIQVANDSDCLALVGSHYMAPAIKEVFEISFD